MDAQFKATHYIVKARYGQNEAQALAERLDLFLVDGMATMDRRTRMAKDMQEALRLVRAARALIEEHDGFFQ